MATEPEGPPIVVVGASAGGIDALTVLVRGLAEDFPAAVAVVLHLPPSGTSVLPAILGRASRLPTTAAADGEPVLAGHICVAPPDCHLIVNPGELALSSGPRENGHRPSIDTLFRTAARSYGRRAIGVVLSGTLDDGAAGLAHIKECGGTAVVQDPGDAVYRGMPDAAIERVAVDQVRPARELPRLLSDLVSGSPPEPVLQAVDPPDSVIPAPVGGDNATVFICPECGGALWEVDEAGVTRFRCRIGHAFSPDTLVDEQGYELENALWTALRALAERAELMHRLSARASTRGRQKSARAFTHKARDAERQAAIVRAGMLAMALDVAATEEDPTS